MKKLNYTPTYLGDFSVPEAWIGRQVQVMKKGGVVKPNGEIMVQGFQGELLTDAPGTFVVSTPQGEITVPKDTVEDIRLKTDITTFANMPLGLKT